MLTVQDIVSRILDQALFNSKTEYDYSGVSAETWEEVYNEFKEHTILLLPAEILSDLGLPEDIKKNWESRILKRSVQFFRLAEQQKEMLQVLEDAEIPTVILKGMAAGVYYPFPWLRSYGDIDFLVTPAYFDRALDALRTHGFEIDPSEENSRRHVAFVKEKIHFEMHRYFSDGTENPKEQALDEILYTHMDRIQMSQVHQYDFPMLPWIPNGLVLLAHMSGHLKAGLGFRQIIDWLMFVKNEVTDREWPAFKVQSDRIGLTGLAIYVTRMGQLFLGFPEEGFSWCKEADEKSCEILFDYLFRSGNFGRKKKDSSLLINAMTVLRVNSNVFAELQRTGMRDWKAVKKHPWLKPFAWAWKICSYIGRVFKSKSGLKTVRESNEDSKNLTDVIKKMGIE